MALPGASGRISLAEDRLMNTLANTAAFRTWCGAANPTEALTKIHQDALPEPAAKVYTIAELNGYRPFAIIWTDPDGGFRMQRDSISDTFRFADGGRITAYLEQEPPDGYESDPEGLARTVKNSIGGIVEGVLLLAGQASYLAARACTVYGPYRSQLDEAPASDECVSFFLDFEWGRV